MIGYRYWDVHDGYLRSPFRDDALPHMWLPLVKSKCKASAVEHAFWSCLCGVYFVDDPGMFDALHSVVPPDVVTVGDSVGRCGRDPEYLIPRPKLAGQTELGRAEIGEYEQNVLDDVAELFPRFEMNTWRADAFRMLHMWVKPELAGMADDLRRKYCVPVTVGPPTAEDRRQVHESLGIAPPAEKSRPAPKSEYSEVAVELMREQFGAKRAATRSVVDFIFANLTVVE